MPNKHSKLTLQVLFFVFDTTMWVISYKSFLGFPFLYRKIKFKIQINGELGYYTNYSYILIYIKMYPQMTK